MPWDFSHLHSTGRFSDRLRLLERILLSAL